MTSSRPDPELGSHRNTGRGDRLPIEPMDPAIKSIQPGGGVCMKLELLWGWWRRFILKRLRPGYVREMRELRQGDCSGCPHEMVDPRDLKFYRNVCDCSWPSSADPFSWRDKLPFARAGLAELIIFTGICFTATGLLAFVYWPASLVPLVLGLFVVSFFRNPKRRIPTEAGLVVSPADGKVVTIERVDFDEFVGGPAVLVGIFLSIFNVHVNRSPSRCRVIGLSYQPGKFLNALRPASARENEQLAIRLEEDFPPFRRMIVRQIAGAIARRIVCWLKPGDDMERGELFGMIKFGSRTELVMPFEEGLKIEVAIGDTVHGGSSVIARYDASESLAPPSAVR